MKSYKQGWALIYTKPRHEKKVFGQLTEMGIHSFLPLTQKIRIWRNQKKYVHEPLFPGYVFIKVNKLEEYYQSLECDGSLYYVKFGKEIAKVNNETIDKLRIIADKKLDVEVSDSRFAPGQIVEIKKGVFLGVRCEVVNYRNIDKILVRIPFLNRNVLAHISQDTIAS
ncbi:MAG: UpxY family transcription antiterminator [Ferruginibacter sp.]|nr:UpxY family transcription antiterminator [Ferruginibacter sp.]